MNHRNFLPFVGSPIRSLQEMLRVISYQTPEIPRVLPTGHFEGHTLEGVMVMQREMGLPVTGIVNRETWDAIEAAYQSALISRNEQEGQHAKSSRLYAAQGMFNALSQKLDGICPTEADGICDETTLADLHWLQHAANLPETEELDGQCFDILCHLCQTFIPDQEGS